jgi:protein-S-isoprenylcysteine O-methyltransferase Ste14
MNPNNNINKATLVVKALIKLLLGFGMMGIMLFLTAGTWMYYNAWLFIVLLFIPMLGIGIYLLLRKPELLLKRLNNKESRSQQKLVLLLSSIMFIGGFTVAGFDYRFAWSSVPKGVVIIATAVFLIGYLLYAEVMRENTYLSRTIEIQKDQQLIDTGLYSVVRHPMYLATLLIYLTIPLILGSFWSLLFFGWYPFLIAKRIIDEESLLDLELPGYSEYKKRVRYRLIPGIW